MLLFNFNVHKSKMSLFVDCGSTYTLENGAVNFTGIKTTFQHTAPVYCEEGYEIHGSHQITCQSNGQWSQSVRCQIISMYICYVSAIKSNIIYITRNVSQCNRFPTYNIILELRPEIKVTVLQKQYLTLNNPNDVSTH